MSVDILEAIADPALFKPWFRTSSWDTWTAFLCALFGLPMNAEQLELYKQCTGRTVAPTSPAREGWLVCGRRAGKSFVLALTAVYLATFRDYTKYLAPGERGTLLILAADRKQSRVIFRFLSALLKEVPMLARLVENERAESFDLNSASPLKSAPAHIELLAVYTFVAVLADELALAIRASPNPDTEVLAAIRPGMATIPNAMLLCASNPYARSGALYDAHQKFFGKDRPILVWQAARGYEPRRAAIFHRRGDGERSGEYSSKYSADFATTSSSYHREAVQSASMSDTRATAIADMRWRAWPSPYASVIARAEDYRRLLEGAGLLRPADCRRVLRDAEAIPHHDRDRRCLRRRMAAREVSGTRHPIRSEQEIEERSLSRPFADDQFAADPHTRPRQDGAPVHRA
jgi:hypothetical protein